MSAAPRGLGEARLLAELESLLGKRPDKKNRAVRWSDLNAVRKSLINAGGAGTLDGAPSPGDEALPPAIPGTAGAQLIARLEQAKIEIDAAAQAAQAARDRAQNALSALENAGVIYRAANIVTLPDGSRTAGIEAYVWDDDGNGTGSALLLHGDEVMAPGTLSANILVAGFGNNLIQNSRFYDGLTHWRRGGNSEAALSVREAGSTWAHPSFRTLRLFQDGTTVDDGYIEFAPEQDGGLPRIVGAPCRAGTWYGASGHLSSHNCASYVQIRFYDVDGAFIPGSARASDNVVASGSSANPDLWPRAFVKAQAPAGACYVSVRFRKAGTDAGSATSQMFLWKPMIEETHEAATAPGAYASNETSMMTGDMIYSRTLAGRHLVIDDAIITGQAQMGDAVVNTLSIAGNAVTVPAYVSSARYGPGESKLGSPWTVETEGTWQITNILDTNYNVGVANAFTFVLLNISVDSNDGGDTAQVWWRYRLRLGGTTTFLIDGGYLHDAHTLSGAANTNSEGTLRVVVDFEVLIHKSGWNGVDLREWGAIIQAAKR